VGGVVDAARSLSGSGQGQRKRKKKIGSGRMVLVVVVAERRASDAGFGGVATNCHGVPDKKRKKKREMIFF
jgi:hypothetical protein